MTIDLTRGPRILPTRRPVLTEEQRRRKLLRSPEYQDMLSEALDYPPLPIWWGQTVEVHPLDCLHRQTPATTARPRWWPFGRG